MHDHMMNPVLIMSLDFELSFSGPGQEIDGKHFESLANHYCSESEFKEQVSVEKSSSLRELERTCTSHLKECLWVISLTNSL